MAFEGSSFFLAMFVQQTEKKLRKDLLVPHHAYERGLMCRQVIPAPYPRLQVAKSSSCHPSKTLTANVSGLSVRDFSEDFQKKSAALTANHRKQRIFLDDE